MPKAVQKWGSISILSTIGTFMILSILGWTGIGTLKAYDNSVSVDFVKDQMTNMNQSLTEILVLQHQRNGQIEKNTLRIEYCEKHQKRCEEVLNDL